MSTLNNITERHDEATRIVSIEEDLEPVYIQRHLDSGATFEEVRSRVVGTLKATTWFREASAWAEVRTLIEQTEVSPDFEDLTECIEDLRDLAPDEGADIL